MPQRPCAFKLSVVPYHSHKVVAFTAWYHRAQIRREYHSPRETITTEHPCHLAIGPFTLLTKAPSLPHTSRYVLFMCKFPVKKVSQPRTWRTELGDYRSCSYATGLKSLNLQRLSVVSLQRLWSSRLLLALINTNANAFNYESFCSHVIVNYQSCNYFEKSKLQLHHVWNKHMLPCQRAAHYSIIQRLINAPPRVAWHDSNHMQQ